MDNPLDVQISLVNTNNRELLRGCLRTIPAACSDLAWKVTVVDNASDDGSAAMIRADFPWAHLIEGRRRNGFAVNHNRVLAPAIADRRARYVLVLNEDVELEPGSIGELVAFADGRADLAATGPVIRGRDGKHQPSYFRSPTLSEEVQISLLPSRGSRRPAGKGWIEGSCLLLRVRALEQVGSLDERFFIFFEDADLGVRLAHAGWKSELCPTARIVHLGHQTVSKPATGGAMERQMLRSRYLYFQKHRGRGSAAAAVALTRTALGLRTAKALGESLVRSDGSARELARLLFGLARYDPRCPLPHERGTDARSADSTRRPLEATTRLR